MNLEIKNYLESLGAEYNHKGCEYDRNGEWLLKIKEDENEEDYLHIPIEALVGGYFKNKLVNPITLENLKEIINYVENEPNPKISY